MKVSMDGNLEDRQLEDGKKIVESIYDILRREWFHVMRAQFDNEQIDYFAIAIFWLLILDFPSKDELTDLLYAKETEFLCEDASWSRCEKMASKIILLRSRVDQNLSITDDPDAHRQV